MDLQLHVNYTPVGTLRPSEKNARTHTKQQIQQIARSIKEFGFINPVLVDATGTVIAGHGRLLAARQLGLTQVPTIGIEHLSEPERRAYRLADNKIAENAGWDSGLLKIELSALSAVEFDFDVELSGFSTPEVDMILGGDDLSTLIEPVPEEPPDAAHVVSRPGDLWRLGPHRLLCADTRDQASVERLINGQCAQMVITDPPYNVPIDGHASGLGRHHHADFKIACGELSSEAFVDFLASTLGNLARVSMEGALHYVFMDWRHLDELLKASRSIYSAQLNLCVWAKTNGGMGSLYRSQHELVGVFKVGKASHLNQVELGRHGRYRTNVWRYAGMNSISAARDESLCLHPTIKPVALVADAIMDVTRRGDIVLDGFVGAGTTILAADQVGRIAYGIELEPGYVDVTIRRWHALTGDTACLAGNGAAFEDVAAARLAPPTAEALR